MINYLCQVNLTVVCLFSFTSTLFLCYEIWVCSAKSDPIKRPTSLNLKCIAVYPRIFVVSPFSLPSLQFPFLPIFTTANYTQILRLDSSPWETTKFPLALGVCGHHDPVHFISSSVARHTLSGSKVCLVETQVWMVVCWVLTLFLSLTKSWSPGSEAFVFIHDAEP